MKIKDILMECNYLDKDKNIYRRHFNEIKKDNIFLTQETIPIKSVGVLIV